jgi:hypothetical protein
MSSAVILPKVKIQPAAQCASAGLVCACNKKPGFVPILCALMTVSAADPAKSSPKV